MAEGARKFEIDKFVGDITTRKMHMLRNRQLMIKDPAIYLENKAKAVSAIEPLLKSKYEATMLALENSGLPENARHAEARKAVENLYREEIKIADETYPEDFIGKGVEKKLKSLYNRLNLLFLDMDSGMSEVNILNRLHFIVMSAREGMQSERLVKPI